MIENISKLIVSKILTTNTIEAEDFECYLYGCEILVSKCIITLAIVLCGLISNTVLGSIIFALAFTLLRQYTGGYHSNTADRCLAASLTVYFIFLVVYKSLSGRVSIILLVISIITVPIIVLLSPVESENKPLDVKEKNKYHIMSIIVACALMLLSIMGYILKLSSVFIVASCVLFLDASMLLLEKIKERSRRND